MQVQIKIIAKFINLNASIQFKSTIETPERSVSYFKKSIINTSDVT